MSTLAGLNTLGIPAVASDLRRIHSAADLASVWRDGQSAGWLPRLLGGGSNVVLADEITAPLCLMRISGINATEAAGAVHVRAAAGENWHSLVRWCLGRGLSGLENLSLIPGSVGAAPVQNIGAYGVELAERFVTAEVLDLETGNVREMDGAELDFGYRTSLLKGAPDRFAVLAVTLRLDAEPGRLETGYPDLGEELARMGRAGKPTAVDVAEAVIRVRRRKLPDPRVTPNAGSFFKNPVVTEARYAELVATHGPLKRYPDATGVKLAAAQLIEGCMNRGGTRPSWAAREAPVRVWERQPLVLTNPGRRPADEVLAVAGLIQEAVAARYEIRLLMEPDLVGA